MSVDNFDALFNGKTPEEVEDVPLDNEVHEEPADQEETLSEEIPQDTTEEASETEALLADDEDDVKPNVPLPTFLGMKDKYRDEKAERIAAQEREAALKKQLEQYQAAAPKVDQAPDPFHDPRGYVEEQLFTNRLQMSHAFNLKLNDPADVEAAIEWGKAHEGLDPKFTQAIKQSADPIGFVIQQHKAALKQQETARQLEEFQRDPEAFARKVAEEKGWLAQPAVTETATVTTPTERKLPKSLSDIPAANPATRVKPADAKKDFNSLFNG